MIERQAIPAAVFERDASAALDRLEADLDLGRLIGLEVVSTPLEDESLRRFPDPDLADLA